MKRTLQFILASLLLILNHRSSTAFAQGTAFTYQGQLQNNGSPANGSYNLTFTLYNTSTVGTTVAGPVTNNAVGVTNGLFTVMIDFGSSPWNGQTNWLQIGVASNGITSFNTLTPRQQLTPVPYSITAENAVNFSGTLNASQLTSVGNTSFGASDNFFVGPSGNSTTSGYNNTTLGVGALVNNTIGYDNTAEGSVTLAYNTIGSENTALGYGALYFNTRGSANTAVGYNSLNDVSTGSNNIALGAQAGLNISTGNSNIDIGNLGFATDTNIIRIGSGQSQAFIAGVINGNGGGLTNLNASQLTSIGNTNGSAVANFFLGSGGNSTMSGAANTGYGYLALVNNTGGAQNTANGAVALNANTIGVGNTVNGFSGLVSNTVGNYNTADGQLALASNTNGSQNTADGNAALAGNTSGYNNTAVGSGALGSNTTGSNNIALGFGAGQFITTGHSNIDIGNPGSPGDTSITRIGNAQSQTFIAGVINGNGSGLTNLMNVSAAQLTSVGNTNGPASGNFFVGPSGNSTMTGVENTANGMGALTNNTTGAENTANGFEALATNTIGVGNVANGTAALLVNTTGNYNTADGLAALYRNTSGSQNTADGVNALGFCTTGSYNIAVGYFAGDDITIGSSNIDIGNYGNSADNNVIRIGTTQSSTYLVGTVYANSVALTSDRNAKENFKPVDSQTLLAKVTALPISQWNYKADSQAVQHLGPMAQDFQAAFQLDGSDDKHISVVDEGGVALAAIQGLNQKLETKCETLQAQNDSLSKELNELKAEVKLLERKE